MRLRTLCVCFSHLRYFPSRLRRLSTSGLSGSLFQSFSQVRPGRCNRAAFHRGPGEEVMGNLREEGASGPFVHCLQRSHAWGLWFHTNLYLRVRTLTLGLGRFIKLMGYWIVLVHRGQFGWAGRILWVLCSCCRRWKQEYLRWCSTHVIKEFTGEVLESLWLWAGQACGFLVLVTGLSQVLSATPQSWPSSLCGPSTWASMSIYEACVFKLPSWAG